MVNKLQKLGNRTNATVPVWYHSYVDCVNEDMVMCAITFAAKETDLRWVLGFDPSSAEWNGDSEYIGANSGGRGKQYPRLGPTCVYTGVSVPTFCCASENGSITA